MRTFLSHDEASGELRLVMTDLWDGQHERTEFRVVRDDGSVMRNRPELDGKQAHEDRGAYYPWYIQVGDMGGRSRFRTEDRAVDLTAKVPCPKAENRRRKCALCA
jgi:hypothetical protein